MPAKSEKQRRLFGMALAKKEGRTQRGGEEVNKLTKLPLQTLRDFASKPKKRS